MAILLGLSRFFVEPSAGISLYGMIYGIGEK